jgi:hypothetical protein
VEPPELDDSSNGDGSDNSGGRVDLSSTRRGALHVERLRKAVSHPVAIMTSRDIDATRRIVTRFERSRPRFGSIALNSGAILDIAPSVTTEVGIAYSAHDARLSQ